MPETIWRKPRNLQRKIPELQNQNDMYRELTNSSNANRRQETWRDHNGTRLVADSVREVHVKHPALGIPTVACRKVVRSLSRDRLNCKRPTLPKTASRFFCRATKGNVASKNNSSSEIHDPDTFDHGHVTLK